MPLDRRTLIGGGALTAAALAAAAGEVVAQVPATAPAAPPPAPAPPDVTGTLARYVVAARYEDLPPNVRKEAARTLINWVGVAVGGSHDDTIDRAVAAMAPFSGKPEATVFGRKEKLDIFNAAFMNAVSSHIFDYDDTHLKTIIHPAGPVCPSLLAMSQRQPVTGTQFLNAFVLGMETELRIGNCVYPSHYDMGWHITGSCGMFGSAAACGKLLGLDNQQMIYALGVAASQPVGLKIQFGSMTKAFHPARATQNGMLAAHLAKQGYTSAEAVLEGKDGWVQALSREHKYGEIMDGLGTRYEAALNTYKPFACGVVTHPAIDAAIQLRNEYHLTADQVDSIQMHAKPLVLSLTGKTDPQTGLDGKFSVYHCIAVGLIYGAAGQRQFEDAVARDPTVVALRRKVTIQTDPAVPAEKCDLTIKLKDGRVLTKHIENVISSQNNPLTDAQLEAKFVDLATGILPGPRIRQLMDLCWGVEKLPDVSVIAKRAAA